MPFRTTIVVLLLLLSLPAQGQELEVTIVPDAWPKRPRSIGYEYNQKNHNAPPRFLDRGQAGHTLEIPTPKDRRYRVVGVRIENLGEEPVSARIACVGFRKGKKLPLQLGAKEVLVRYYPIREPKDSRFEVEVFAKSGPSRSSPRPSSCPPRGATRAGPARPS